ncbi:MAG: carbohydrate kinase family protein [Candidatus Helarchaeota archaeon]|nr:carbohydrate kinase family protein [Candidatus Helarchaeota archaeon]
MVPDVVAIGDINIDIITSPLSTDIVKQKDVEVGTKFSLALGGNAGNCAMATSKLGLKTRLIGALSSDPISKWLIDILEENKVDFHNCFKETQSAITFAITYEDGTRIFLSDFGANALLSFEDINLELIEGQHLHRAGYWWAPKLKGSGTRRLFQIAREKNLTTSLDIGWDPDDWSPKSRDSVYECLEFCDILFLNNKELEGLTQAKMDEGASLILEKGIKMIGLHYGAKGCKIYTTEKSVHVPSYKVQLNNPTGTGDIFNAAFIYGYLQKWPLEKIGKFSNACAAIHLSDRTTPYPAFIEVENFIKSNDD